MGTSIHPFIEYDITSDNPGPFCAAMDGKVDLRAFNAGEFFVFNDYELYDALAFGRSVHNPNGRTDGKRPLFPARGLPAHLTWQVALRYFHVVLDPEYDKTRFDPTNSWYGSATSVSREQAMAWIEKGFSQWGNNLRQGVWPKESVSFDLVSNPDWRTASWLSLAEIGRALSHFDYQLESAPAEFHAILAAMETLEKHYGAGKTRLVFWFDN